VKKRGSAHRTVAGSLFLSYCIGMIALVKQKKNEVAELCRKYQVERLFGRHVDLVTQASVRNPYFRQSVDATRQPLYEH